MRAKIQTVYSREIWAGLSFNTWYKIHAEKDGCFLIQDDSDQPIWIYPYGCMYLDGGDWEIQY